MEPEFLEVEDVLEIHELQFVRFGGAAGVRDQGLLESAVAVARASFELALPTGDVVPH